MKIKVNKLHIFVFIFLSLLKPNFTTAQSFVYGILSTGQSLSVGFNSANALTITQPYNNLMLSGTSNGGGRGLGTSLVPLVENSSTETHGSAMANTISANAGMAYDIALNNCGVPSFPYANLKRGTAPYFNGLNQITSIKNAVNALGRTSKVIAITAIHGETDNHNYYSSGYIAPYTTQYNNYLALYESHLVEWQANYQTDIQLITGQTSNIPMFTDQVSSFFTTYGGTPTSSVPISQLAAAEHNPGLIYLVTPKYFLDYSDIHHLTEYSYRKLGEYYGKVIKKVVIDGIDWKPLSPWSVYRNGANIYAIFHVPADSIKFDTINVVARANMGFEYFDSSNSSAISSVQILGKDTVKISLTNIPTGTSQRLSYAYTGVLGSNTGGSFATSAAGNLRDNDNFPSLYGNNLYNWCVHFDKIIDTCPTVVAPITGAHFVCSGGTTTLSCATDGGVWSSSSAIASVSRTGVVTGIGSGLDTIIYTYTNACGVSTSTFTVNVIGSVLGGSSSVCQGAAISLTSTNSGGVWSSSSANVSIGSSSGIAIGVSVGTSIISYTYTSGCTTVATKTITVNTLPNAISGANGFCPGANAQYINATPGGKWSSRNITIATIDSMSGIATGVATGTSVITFTLVSGCYAVKTVSINPLPDIVGNTVLSTAIKTTLYDSVAGGTWTSGNMAIATAGSASGIISGLTNGTAVISYATSGCVTTTTVTVKTPSTGINLDGSNDYIDIGNLLTSGSSYTKEAWIKVSSATGNILSATNFPFFFAGRLIVSNGYGTGSVTTITDPNSFPLNEWVHVAATYNSATTTLRLYVNGRIVAFSNSANSYTAGNLQIGAYNGGTNLLGSIDEVRLWNIARTTDQINADMNCDVPQQANLIAYYRFDEGVSSGNNTNRVKVADYSGNLNCGTLTNLTLNGVSSNYVTGANGTCNTITLSQPNAITGLNTVCVTNSVTLSNTASGGTWASSNTAVATIDASGNVTGVLAGTTVITYTLNCSVALYTITVSPSPATITGNSTMCAGGSSLLTNAAIGGVWTSDNANATVGSTTGLVTGVTAGTSVISYTIGTCGSQTKTVTINPNIGVPQISSVSPASGFPLSAVTIVGANFSPVATDNIVYFGATRATVTAATTTSLTVTVPVYANAQQIYVQNSCILMGFAQYPFVPNFSNSTYVANSVNMSPRVNFTAGSGAQSSAVMDVDGDGKPDIVTVNNLANSVSVYRNTSTSGTISTASFAAKVDYATVTSPEKVVIGDVDGDGKPELIVTGKTANGVSVLKNNCTSGTLSFAAKVDFTVGNTPWGATLADVDMDGKPEIIVANIAGNNISVLRNTSVLGFINASSFAGKVDYAVGSSPTAITTGDLNGDGKPEIIVCNAGANNISVLRNTSSTGGFTTGSFATGVTFLAGTLPIDVIVTDLDADGKQDAIVCNRTGNVISVLKNTTTSSLAFATRVNYTTGPTPQHLSVGDIDGDGKTDLVTCNSGDSTYSILRNTTTGGTINFATKVDLSCPTGPMGITVSDVDGDYKPDVVITGSATSVFKNNPIQLTTGTSNICVNTSATLANATTGGVWVSSNTSVATVNSSSGLVTGIAAGTSVISYSLTGGSATFNMSVSTVSSISGSAAICIGSSHVYTNATTGGRWYSSAVGVAAIDSLTGTLTAVSTGTAVITYVAGVCSTFQNVTVNPNPAAITGTTTICGTNATLLSNATSGGSWSSNATGVVTVGTTGLATGVSAGTAIITYSLSSGCFATYAMSVKPNPISTGVTNSGGICVGGNSTLNANTTNATSWAWVGSDGYTSTVQNPSVSPSATTVYSLTVSSVGAGCSPGTIYTNSVVVSPVPTAAPSSAGSVVMAIHYCYMPIHRVVLPFITGAGLI